MRCFFVLAFSLFFSVLAAQANAQAFAPLTYSNVLKSLVRFDALNMQDDAILDDFAQITECDQFHKNYRDDFAKQQRRQALRDDVKKNRMNYPDSYYFTTQMRLDKFDFKARAFMLEKDSQLKNINSFSLVKLRSREVCVDNVRLGFLPLEIGATLDQPVTVEGLPISEEKAKALIATMNAAKNYNRIIYARFSMLLVYAPPIKAPMMQRYNADAQLLSVEFFEDKEMTRPIWIYTRA